jgi:hypothetical protein
VESFILFYPIVSIEVLRKTLHYLSAFRYHMAQLSRDIVNPTKLVKFTHSSVVGASDNARSNF